MAETPAPPVRTLSLKSRVALAVGAVLLLGGVVVLAVALAYGRQAAREAYDRLLVGAASDIAASMSVRDGAVVVDMPVSAFQMLALAPEDRIRYRVIGPDGATLTGSDAAPLPPEREGVGPVFYDGDLGAEPGRYVAVTRRFAERGFSGPVRVLLGQTTRARAALARDIAQGALAVLAAAGVVIGLFAWLATRSALRPLQRLGGALAERDPTDLTPLALPMPSEIAPMLGALNGFMGRLDRQLAASRNLIGDAAHQLRTPVAAIRAQAQLAQDECDPEARARILGRIHERSVGLSRLLDRMLDRALIIHRTDTAPRAALDLRDVALEVFEEVDAAAIAPGARVRLDLPPGPLVVRGDALSLTEAGKNLLANALAHGRAPIRLGVAREGGRARLFVRDAGPGPSEAVLSGLGARFTSGAPGGSGLGLAIAREVAESHGGALLLGRSGDGFEAALALPRAGAA
ncbi:sensor histidine kinase [Limimaricola pyoseonensis]|uniref:histidine kinase n=1 Tax=Limimaricola pyoseonensis TaxID=521013 RepID=A0A1G7CM11_9RHOB|nr:sensor histidine kinase [Limimaricola pyoseonensis]SDE40271.1 two-component system, OmpR family, sensor histidine kinase TctE [Limimaricola pyoseonensis]